MTQNEIKKHIQEHTKATYEYINTCILKDIGYMNYNYFKNILEKEIDKVNEKNINILPYFIFTTVEKNGNVDYTSLRSETIDFALLNKEASVYYNYAQFSLDGDFLIINLMQTKIGGMPIDKDIIKYTKKIPIEVSKYEELLHIIK